MLAHPICFYRKADYLKMLKKAVLFPFMVAVYPVLALLAQNLGQINSNDAIRPVLLTVVVSGLVFIFTGRLFRDWRKAGLVTAIVFIQFFSYGHIYRALEGTTLAGVNLGRHRFLILFFGLILLGGSIAIARMKKIGDAWLVLLNTASITMVLLTLVQIGSYEWERWQAAQQGLASIQNPADRFDDIEQDTLPDIYYIILDEYGRQDVLKAVYGYDNQVFEAFLTATGFQVLSESRTNYADTELVLSSVLNLDYLQDLGRELDPNSSDRSILSNWIRRSRVQRALEDVGYHTISFSTGFTWSQLDLVDDYRQPSLTFSDQLRSAGVTNVFEGVLMRNSAGLILIDALQKYQADLDYPTRMHRARIIYTLDQLAGEIPSIPGPKFVFAHVIAPHAPAVIGPNGEVEVSSDPQQGYRDEVTYLNRRLQEVVESILSASERDVIIILQSDTGPKFQLGLENPTTETYWVRLSNFNAIYLPDNYWVEIPGDISSVNTFRLIFNLVFNAEYPILADHSYYTHWGRPYDFTDVTDQMLSYP